MKRGMPVRIGKAGCYVLGLQNRLRGALIRIY